MKFNLPASLELKNIIELLLVKNFALIFIVAFFQKKDSPKIFVKVIKLLGQKSI